MKRIVVALILSVALASAAYAADIDGMIQSNFVFKSSDALCSSTLISTTQRLALTNYHCVADSISTVEREEVAADGTVKKVTRAVYNDVTLSQYAYSKSGIVGAVVLKANIVAADRRKDLAVLQIESETSKLPKAAVLPGDDYKLHQGQVVYAIGNPIGLENTITKGILSHLYREYRWEADQIARYIQTDATIAGGSSGGSLYSEDGLLIGVPSAGYRGAALSFAIPYWVVKDFLTVNGYSSIWDSSAPSHEQWLADQKKKAEEKK